MHQEEQTIESSTTLSQQAIADLRVCLNKDIGYEHTLLLSDAELEQIGMLLLTTMALGLKIKCR